MTTPHQGRTNTQHTIQQIPVALKRDYITVVGASHMTLMEKLRGQKGNKMRFINQGIRQIRLYPPATANHATQRIFLIFTENSKRFFFNPGREVLKTRTEAKSRNLTP